MRSKLKSLTLVLATATALFCGSASAAPIDAWRFDLSLINGLLLSDGTIVGGATDATNVDHLVINGFSTVQQNVLNGSAAGQSFIDSGALQFLSNDRESPFATLPLIFGTNNLGATIFGYIRYDGLTGTLNADGTINFNPGVGTITLYIEDDGDLNPLTGGVRALVSYTLINPSGGSDLDFFGGAGQNATVDVTLQATSTIAGLAGIFSDSANNPLTTIVLHLVNVDSLLDPNFNPNPDNTGVINGTGVSVIHVQNAGQYNLAQVPEPGTLALLGLALAGFGFRTSRQKKVAS